jgi:ribose transport system ATP-binding protein
MTAAAAASTTPVASAQPFLKLSGLRKTYPGVVALADFSLDVAPGEIIGLVGENGAGKSTLMKILGGVTPPDRGTIEIDGSPHDRLTVAGSIAAGISFVHQELNLFGNLDVAANVYFGREPTRGGPLRFVDEARLHRVVQPYLDLLGANFPATALVSSLSLAQQQMVEIAKALSFNSRLLILDEPTSSLPIAETEKLLDVMRRLRNEGISIFFISHRLNEIVAVCDRVVVLRDGKLAGGLGKGEITHDAMVKLMVGRDLRVAYLPPKVEKGDVVLAARNVRTSTYPHREVSLELHSGEVLGLAGLVGAGRTELARTFFGIDQTLGGELLLDGNPIRIASSADAIRHGIFLVPEDRKGSGILLDLPISENISLPNLPFYARSGMVSADAEKKQAEASKRELDIRAPSVATRTGSLSGGNQQKVVLAKWLAMKPRVMIFDEPTRGIDIGAKSEIYRLMRALADNGVAVLMISSDMEEVIGVSDRIAVMHEGNISGILGRDKFSEENILRLAVGKTIETQN